MRLYTLHADFRREPYHSHSWLLRHAPKWTVVFDRASPLTRLVTRQALLAVEALDGCLYTSSPYGVNVHRVLGESPKVDGAIIVVSSPAQGRQLLGVIGPQAGKVLVIGSPRYNTQGPNRLTSGPYCAGVVKLGALPTESLMEARLAQALTSWVS